MKVTNHHLAEALGWQRVHYYDFVRFEQYRDGARSSNMYQWVQTNIPADRWVSWNGDMWFKDPKDATLFGLRWA